MLRQASFFADALCAYPISSIDIGAGASSQSFYFEPTIAGTPTVMATAGGFPPISQIENAD